MWFAYPSPHRYAIITRYRSAPAASGRRDQRTASHDTIAMPTSETVYTFSFTTD